MQITFTGHHVEVTPALRELATSKLEKLTRHYDKIVSINVTFKVDKLQQVAEATVYVAKNEIHAHADSEDLYTAIDLMVDKLDRQLKKHKEKHSDHRD
jgi:putative sigma-54 modulation protein